MHRLLIQILLMLVLIMMGCSEPSVQAGTYTDQPNTVATTLDVTVVDTTGAPVTQGFALLLKSNDWASSVEKNVTVVLDSSSIDSAGGVSFDTIPDVYNIQITSDSLGAFMGSSDFESTPTNDSHAVEKRVTAVPLGTMRFAYDGSESLAELRIIGSTYRAHFDSAGVYVFNTIPLYSSQEWDYVGVSTDTAQGLITVPSTDLTVVDEERHESSLMLIESFETKNGCPEYPVTGECSPFYWIENNTNRLNESDSSSNSVLIDGSLDGASYVLTPSDEKGYAGLKLMADSSTIRFSHLDSISFYAQLGWGIEEDTWIVPIFYSVAQVIDSADEGSVLFQEKIQLTTEWIKYTLTFKDMRLMPRSVYTSYAKPLEEAQSVPLDDSDVPALLENLVYIHFVTEAQRVALDSIQFYGAFETNLN